MKTLLDRVIWGVFYKHGSIPPGIKITKSNSGIFIVFGRGLHEKFISDEYKKETYINYFDSYEQAFYAAWRWHLEGRK